MKIFKENRNDTLVNDENVLFFPFIIFVKLKMFNLLNIVISPYRLTYSILIFFV